MHPIFEITAADIKALNDLQARVLIARLCKSELRGKGVGTDAVTWGGDQRAKDGGVDVRVEINPAIGITGYIPNDSTAYQVKAESFIPSKISGEMAPKGVLRQAIHDCVSKSGAYVIVSTRDSLSDSSLQARKKAMAECLEHHGLATKVYFDFYDSQKIADWTENYPPTVTWLKQEIGRPLIGWQSYGPWAYHETNVEDEYLLDDKVKVYVPDSDAGFSIHDAIDRLRGELGTFGASTRIVGLSGVGKTRFVQAIFDRRIATGNKPPNLEGVLYTDISHNPTPQPIAMLEALYSVGSDCFVVVDNCGQEIHQKLTEIVKRSGSKIRLVTIEYDIRDDLPEGTSCYRLEGSSAEVIAKLLKRRYGELSDVDVDKIVEFSDGNARVAFALASTSQIKGELAQLTDDALFQRLFLQKNNANAELLRCAETASLVYSFDAQDTSENSEMSVLAELSEVTVPTFFRNITELQRRGLIQERGPWKAVLPHAISNRLATRAIQAIPSSVLVRKFVTESSGRVARSFSRRLGYLHESKQAQHIVSEWLKLGGLLGDAMSLSDIQQQMLENIAPVNQRATLELLMRAVQVKEFISISNRNRSHFARLLRLLAYEDGLFDDAASALMLFALQEPEDYKSESARDILQSLFYIHLSGTYATPQKRAAFIKSLWLSGEIEKQKLAVFLLRAALESTHFSCHYSFDFGALKRSFGWQPVNSAGVMTWYSLFIDIAVEIGRSATAIGADVRGLLGRAFRGLWVDAQMCDVLTSAARVLASVDGWPDGWIGVRNTLHWDKTKLEESSLSKLKSLESELAPKDLSRKIQAKVLLRGAYGADLDIEDELTTGVDWHQKAQEDAQALGKAAALDESVLEDLIPFVTQGKTTDKSYSFGIGVGQSAISPKEILVRLKQAIKVAKPEGINTLFIRGFVVGWHKSKPADVEKFLDCAVTDEVFAEIFPELQVAIGLDGAAHGRLMRCLELGVAPNWQFKYLEMGRITDGLTIEQLASILRLLASKAGDGLMVASDVLHMVIHGLDNKSAEYRKALKLFCSKFICEMDWASFNLDSDNHLYHLEKVLNFTLGDPANYEDAEIAIKRLIQGESSNPHVYPRRLGRLLGPFFEKCPMQALDVIYSKDEHGDFAKALRMLSIRSEEYGETGVERVPEDDLISWCKTSPEDRCIFAAQTCKLFEKSLEPEQDINSGLRISRTAIKVLALAPDTQKVLAIFVGRLRPNHWSGSLAEILRKRIVLLDQLNPNNDASLQASIQEAKVRFSAMIAEDEKREQAWERSQAASFEGDV